MCYQKDIKSYIPECPFCELSPEREIIIDTPTAFAIYDKYPVSRGHALIIPKDHRDDYFDLTPEQQRACWSLVNIVKSIIEEKYQPDGFNIGVNINSAAGQTISHVHIHLIPRYTGDVKEPLGGVRSVIPEKRDYSKL